jgi:hypothetical protein
VSLVFRPEAERSWGQVGRRALIGGMDMNEMRWTGDRGDVAKNKLIFQILHRRRLRPNRSIRRSHPNSNLRRLWLYRMSPLLIPTYSFNHLLCLSSWYGSTLRKSSEVRNSNCPHKSPACRRWSCKLAWSRKTDLDVGDGRRVSLISTEITWKINEPHIYLSLCH